MTTTTQRRPKASGTIVLVVEDHPDTLELYATTLRDDGYIVETAENGAEAIDRARKVAAQVILMDLAMPQLDGWGAIEAIRQDSGCKDAWIVAVTARSERHDHDRAYSAGCNAIVLKPAEPSDILAAVRGGLAQRRWREA